MDNYPQVLGAKGTLVGIPHRHAVFLYPIETLEVVTACNILIPVISSMYHDGPGSISNNLFWYYNGEFITLPFEIGEKELKFFPPEEFVDILNTLSEDK